MTEMSCAEKAARAATDFASSAFGAGFALALIVCCLASWPVIGWEGAIGWADPVATLGSFLFLFLLQRSQAKDTLSLQVKLDELLAAVREADDELISVEDLPENEVQSKRDKRRHQ